MLRWRHVDKPTRVSQDYLDVLEKQGKFIATVKKDGWRCILEWDGKNAEFFSRRDLEKGGATKHPVSPELRQAVKEFCQRNELSPGTRLDSEWMARRHEGEQHLIVFGILFLNGQWVGGKTEAERWEIVSKFKYGGPVTLAEHTEVNYREFFERHRNDPTAEGIVLKHKMSRLYGDLKKCRDNPLWFKVKWRDGPDGHGPAF